MPKRSFIYRGFSITTVQRPGLMWCATWKELTGPTVRRTFFCVSESEALEDAKKNIDAYHHKIDIAQYPKGGTK